MLPEVQWPGGLWIWVLPQPFAKCVASPSDLPVPGLPHLPRGVVEKTESKDPRKELSIVLAGRKLNQ